MCVSFQHLRRTCFDSAGNYKKILRCYHSAQHHSTNPQLGFYTGLNHARDVLEICDGERL